jgi:hypothetical protein
VRRGEEGEKGREKREGENGRRKDKEGRDMPHYQNIFQLTEAATSIPSSTPNSAWSMSSRTNGKDKEMVMEEEGRKGREERGEESGNKGRERGKVLQDICTNLHH